MNSLLQMLACDDTPAETIDVGQAHESFISYAVRNASAKQTREAQSEMRCSY